MSKNKNDKYNAPTNVSEASSEAATTPPESPVTGTVETAGVPHEVPAVSGEVVSGAGEALQVPPATVPAVVEDDGYTLAHLAPRLPRWRKLLENFARPQPEEIELACNALPPATQTSFRELVDRMRPTKVGLHLANDRYQIVDAKIFHGTGDDQMRPNPIVPGCIYSRDGKILSAPKEASKMLGAPSELICVVLALHETHTFWPPREGSNGTVPPGHEETKGQPYCSSLDRKRGRTFGDCTACPYRPWRQKGVFECAQDVQLYFAVRGFTGLYRMIISGTSVKTGAYPISNRVRNWPHLYTNYFALDTISQASNGNRWFTLQARHATDENHPQGIAPSPEEAEMYDILARQIEAELYYPQLAQIYSDSQRKSLPLMDGGPTDLSATIAAAQAAEAAAAPMADYSKNNI